MDVHELLAQAKDAMTVKRVYGEPIVKDGVTLIPAAAVQGGGGGGSGEGATDESTGSGAGFGLTARPVGVYVIRGEEVTWEPAFDLNRVILGGQVVAVALLLVVRAAIKRRRKAR